MKKTLQLNIYLKDNNRACMVFKRDGILYRINHLVRPLAFLANMMQLSIAIDTGAEQNCYLVLDDSKGKRWLLACRYLNDVIALDLWLDTGVRNERLTNVTFSWYGSPADFRKSVAVLCARR